MIEKELQNNRPKPELTPEKCVQKAESLIRQNGACLFLFDIKGSRQYSPEARRQLHVELINSTNEMNQRFDRYFPINRLLVTIREDKGFFILGDGGAVGINNSVVVPQIIDLFKEKLPNVSFRFNIARDGYDDKEMRTIK